ncbi:MAG TPA: hypothetical protein VKU19_02945, partial [Bryobacteraceae bacterium]|nr:hypothetical protein [Bryobacteraceae bacterium]
MQKTHNNLLLLIAGICICAAPATAQTAPVTNVGKTVDNMDAITFSSNGTLYGGTSGAGALYTIDPKTGVATLIHVLVGASNPSLTYG